MEQTITQSGALFGVQHRPAKRKLRRSNVLTVTPGDLISTFRASVGEFEFRTVQFGCGLEIVVGKVRRALRVYETQEAAVLALRNRRTGFDQWDLMGRNAAAIQIDTPGRWKQNRQQEELSSNGQNGSDRSG